VADKVLIVMVRTQAGSQGLEGVCGMTEREMATSWYEVRRWGQGWQCICVSSRNAGGGDKQKKIRTHGAILIPARGEEEDAKGKRREILEREIGKYRVPEPQDFLPTT